MPEGIVPWVRAADPAAHVLAAFQAGAQVSQAQARLALAREEMERRTLEQQQELQIQRAYQQQRMDLAQRELELTKQKVGLAASQAAQRFEATQEYRRRVGAGEEPMQVLSEIGPAMGPGWQTVLAAHERTLAMKPRAEIPERLVAKPVYDEKGNIIPGLRQVPTPTGWQTREEPGFVGNLAGERSARIHGTDYRMDYLKDKRKQILDPWGGSLGRKPDAKKFPERAANWDAAKAAIDEIDAERERLAPAVPASGARKPAPPVGTVVRGFQFMGGDASLEQNWRRVQEEEEGEAAPVIAPDEEEAPE